MKKKKLNSLSLNKKKVANLKNLNAISGGGTPDAESRIICPGEDSNGCTGGESEAGCGGGTGGGGGGGLPTFNWMCNHTQSVCGPTQVDCGT